MDGVSNTCVLILFPEPEIEEVVFAEELSKVEATRSFRDLLHQLPAVSPVWHASAGADAALGPEVRLIVGCAQVGQLLWHKTLHPRPRNRIKTHHSCIEPPCSRFSNSSENLANLGDVIGVVRKNWQQQSHSTSTMLD
jgi:hypothetical protein